MTTPTACRVLATAAGLALSATAAAQDFSWAAAVSGNWNDPALWSPNGTPNGAGQNATIDAAGAAYTVTLNIDVELDMLVLDSVDALLQINRNLTLNTSGTFRSGHATIRGRTIDGAGTLTNEDEFTIEGSSSIATSSFVNTGTTTVTGVLGLSTNATFSAPVTNNGLFDLTSSGNGNATLTADSFVNNDTLRASIGSNTTRTVRVASFTNNGGIDILKDTNFNRSGDVYSFMAGSSFDTDASAAAVFQSGVTVNSEGDWNNTGATEFRGAATLLTLSGGNIIGNDLIVNGSDFEINGPVTGGITTTASTDLVANTASTLDITVLGVPGVSATLNFGATPFTSDGSITLDSSAGANGAAFFRGDAFTNEGEFDVEPGSGTGRTVDVVSFTNNGNINVRANTSFNSAASLLTVTGTGSFTTEPGTTATFSSGNDFTAMGQVDNQGGLTFSGNSVDVTLDGVNILGNPILLSGSNLVTDGQSSGTAVLNGNVDLTANAQPGLDFDILGVPGVSATLNFGATPFTNVGVVSLDSTMGANGAATLTGDTLINNQLIESLPGSGTGRTISITSLTSNRFLDIDASTAFNRSGGLTTLNPTSTTTIAPGATATFSSGNDLTLNGGSIVNNGSLLFTGNSVDVTLNGGSITGNPVELNGSNLALTADTSGDFRATSVVDYAIGAGLGSNLNIEVLGVPGVSASLNFTGDFTNNASVSLDSTAGANGTAALSGNTFINNADLLIKPGSGTGRTVTVPSLDNNANLDIDTTVSFNATGGTTSNNAGGTISIAPGTTATFSSSHTLINDGVINNQGSLVVTGNASSLVLNGGAVNGNAIRIVGSNLSTNAPTPASVEATSSANLLTDLEAGVSVIVLGVPGISASLNYGSADRVNRGMLTLDSTPGANGTSTIFGSGSFTNDNSITVLAGSGTQRFINANGFINNAALDLDASLIVTIPSNSNFENHGTLDVATNATFNMNGSGTQTVINTGMIRGDGILDFSRVDVLDNSGTFDPQGSLGVSGDWSQSAAADLLIAIGGTAQGTDYDLLAVTANAMLAGDLVVSLAGGFIPNASDVFTVLTASSIDGMFDNTFDDMGVTKISFDGGTFDVLLSPDSVQLTNFVIPAPASTLALGALGLFAGRRRR